MEETSRRLDTALLNKSLDDIIKENRKLDKTKRAGKKAAPAPTAGATVKKAAAPKRPQPSKKPVHPAQGSKIIRSDASSPPRNATARKGGNFPRGAPKTLRQPWDKPQPAARLPVAPLPTEPLKISIRNEMAAVHHDPYGGRHMQDIDASRHPVYKHPDQLDSRDEYMMGSRFSTQPMAIDYQLARGAPIERHHSLNQYRSPFSSNTRRF